MTNIFLFTQNVKLSSFEKYNYLVGTENIFITTHSLFDNEKSYLNSIFKNCKYFKFADFLSDAEMAACDINAYSTETKSSSEYYEAIKKIKNGIIVDKVLKKYQEFKGYLCSNDLGIDQEQWEKAGFLWLECEYYYAPVNLNEKAINKAKYYVKRALDLLRGNNKSENKFDEIYVGRWNDKKYIFIGSLNRIGYRLNLNFEKSEYEIERFNKGEYYLAEECQYLTTLHECGKCNVPDEEKYDVRYIQDGYLPPNYSSCYLKFKPSNVQYYAWDVLGEKVFKNQSLPVSLIPFRKKLYMPFPKFENKIENVLVIASGSGDWTAQKNRSDDDLMTIALVETARKFPYINFIYRVHPTWIHPLHDGVNSINRVKEYFDSTGLNNIHLSGNVFTEDLSSFVLSVPRSSLEQDLETADIVFGEHSVSMIDAALKGIPFASINLTNRRDFFCGISELGFPTCNIVEDIAEVICNITEKEFQDSYIKAIEQYNAMTDEEE